jgi:hypothetical protein
MQNFKNKLYNYETPPPADLWTKISGELDDQKVVQLKGLRGRSKLIFYGATAAAALIIIFVSSNFFNKHSTGISPEKNSGSSGYISSVAADSINQNYQLLEKIINTPKDKKLLASNKVASEGFSKKYITIAGPEGQPVKISAKVATLILSADKEYPPKPVWNETIDKWQQIMLSNTFSPTSSGLIEMIQMESQNME